MEKFSVPKLPLDDWVDISLDFLTENFAFITKAISELLENFIYDVVNGFMFLPPWLVITIFTLLSWRLIVRERGFWAGTLVAVLIALGLGLINYLDLLSVDIMVIIIFTWTALWQLIGRNLTIVIVIELGLFWVLLALFWLMQLWHNNMMVIALFTLIGWQLAGRKVGLFTFVGLILIWNLQLWEATIETLTLVIVATFIAVLVGLPMGILAAMSNMAYRVIMPLMDLMQTMPAFVYLIPAIPFFGLGAVSAIFSTVVFAMPPAIRFTCLGIKQTPKELIEAADAFGSTKLQKLFKLQLPLAVPTIMAGINQTIMLALSMVVIAAMIGAGGLGGEVWKAIQRLQPGMGFQAGIAIVILAMILDRISQKIGQKGNWEREEIRKVI
jgi:glycine betaine/proline transport system permease protein